MSTRSFIGTPWHIEYIKDRKMILNDTNLVVNFTKNRYASYQGKIALVLAIALDILKREKIVKTKNMKGTSK